MPRKAKTPETSEPLDPYYRQPMTFVQRWEYYIVPTPDTPHIPKRLHRESKLWEFCKARHRSWMRGKAIPAYHDPDYGNEEGWFFPTAWIDEFKTRQPVP